MAMAPTTTPLVLLHGVNNTPVVWGPVRAGLPGMETLAPPLPAREDLASIAEELLGTLPERFAVAGHSLGGYVALEMLRQAPERLAGIALVNSHDGSDDESTRARRAAATAAAREGRYPEVVAAATKASYSSANLDDADLMAARRADTDAYGAGAFVAHQTAAGARGSSRALLEQATVPVLVVTGEDDAVISPSLQTEMAKGVGAEQVSVPHAGHMLPAERPNDLAAALGGWLERTSGFPLPAHEVYGEGDTTIFMLHGAYGDGRYFATTSEYFTERGYRVVVWHCPGYHGTPAPRGTSIQDHAEAAADLVRAVGTTINVILGHSMGGLIAPRAVNLLGDRVHALILSASSAGLGTFPPVAREAFIRERVEPIVQGRTIGEYAPALLKAMMGPGASGPLVDRVVEVVVEMDTSTFKTSMDALIETDGQPALREVTVPTLLIAGEHDSACTPAGMQLMADLVDDSELHIIDGAGHYPFAETPETYHRLVLDFLARRLG